MFDALVATEDERFYDHSGIDARAVFRAVIKRGILGHKGAGGGSTITQQLAKQLFSARFPTAKSKISLSAIPKFLTSTAKRVLTFSTPRRE